MVKWKYFTLDEKTRFITAPVFGLAGLGLLWFATSWVVPLGVFFVIWGNNIGRDK